MLHDSGGKIIRHFRENESPINSVAISPDGQRFLSGSQDNVILLRDISGNIIGKIHNVATETIMAYRANRVAFSPDGKSLP